MGKLVSLIVLLFTLFLFSGCGFSLIERTEVVPARGWGCNSCYSYYPTCGGCGSCNDCNCYISDW